LALKIDQNACERVGHAIFISGAARSGTTILGKVVHSLKDVEYAFEPPLLFSLMPLINRFSSEDWKLLFETYLYEDLLINAVSGRSINCNVADDSSIYLVKSKDEVHKRIDNSLSKYEAGRIAKNKTIALKMPDMAQFLPSLQNFYPGIQIIVMRRNACDTLNSLMHKGWFSDDVLNQGIIWPFNECLQACIPFWVNHKDYNSWVEMPEIDRCAYYYIRMNESFSKVSDRIDIDYDDLLKEPDIVVRDLTDRLGLHFGSKTENIIDSIRPTNSIRDKKILDGISPHLMEMLRFFD